MQSAQPPCLQVLGQHHRDRHGKRSADFSPLERRPTRAPQPLQAASPVAHTFQCAGCGGFPAASTRNTPFKSRPKAGGASGQHHRDAHGERSADFSPLEGGPAWTLGIGRNALGQRTFKRTQVRAPVEIAVVLLNCAPEQLCLLRIVAKAAQGGGKINLSPSLPSRPSRDTLQEAESPKYDSLGWSERGPPRHP